MTRIWTVVGLVALGLGLSGCRQAGNAGPPLGATNAPPAVVAVVGTPQPKLPTVKLLVGDRQMVAEIAKTPQTRQMGMMFRASLGENEGMIFAFPEPHRTAFWMKNTTVPLSAAYIDPSGVIVEIHTLEPRNENSVVATSDRIQFVLETPLGWFERHGVKPGAVVSTEHGPLARTLRTPY